MTSLNDTMETVGCAVDSAKSTVGNAVDSAKKTTEHAASVAYSDILDGLRTVNRIIAQIRSIGMNDALGWIGLERRRSGFESAAIFGSGILVGAGVGMLLAPMSGATMRRTILQRLRGVEKEAENVAVKVKDAVINAEHKVEDVAGRAKDTVIDVAKNTIVGAAKNAVEEKVNMVKDAIVGGAEDAAKGAEQNTDKAKDASAAERKTDPMFDRGKDAGGAERKTDSMADRGRDTSAASAWPNAPRFRDFD